MSYLIVMLWLVYFTYRLESTVGCSLSGMHAYQSRIIYMRGNLYRTYRKIAERNQA